MLSKIFYGKKGCGMDTKALSYAKQLLCLKDGASDCDCRSCQTKETMHPDLLIMNGEKYLAEDVNTITSFATKSPVLSNVCVVLVYGMNKISSAMQNKLLKDLEDNQTFRLVATAVDFEGIILDTIKSRTIGENVYPLPKEEFSKLPLSDCEFYYHLTDGCPERIKDLQDAEPLFREIYQCFANNDFINLFRVLHLVTEKDKQNFFSKHKEFVADLFLFMEKIYINFFGENLLDETKRKVFLNRMCVLEEERMRSVNQWYTANDFFLSVCRFIEVKEN